MRHHHQRDRAAERAGVRELERALSESAWSEYRDPPMMLHGRIIDEIRRRRHERSNLSQFASHFLLRGLAAAACVAFIAGVAFLVSNQPIATSPIASSPGLPDAPGPVVAAANAAHDRDSREKLATVKSFLQTPALLESEMTGPLRSEWGRLAAAGDELLKSTIRRLPPSLRAAAR